MGPLAAVAGGFASGVFLRSLVFQDAWSMLFELFVAAGLSLAWLIADRRAYALGAAFVACVALGMLRTSLTEAAPPDAFLADLGRRVSYEGVVVADADLRDASARIAIEVEAREERVRMLAVVPRTASAQVGDRVTVHGTLALPEAFAAENGRTFRYDKYLEKDGIRFLVEFASLSVESHAPLYDWRAALARAKRAFQEGVAAALPEPYASLASGITIGGKSGLGAELKDAFVRSGLIQIVVLSGYNVMIVAEWVMAALALVAASRRTRAFAGALALLLFVGIAGATATSVRAALMALIALYARATGKTYAASRALLVAIVLMLAWNPLFLAFDPGFGLSVAATAGIIWLAPLIERRLARLSNAFFRNAFATTVAAQAAVLPLLLYLTGTLSLVALPANILAMPLVPIAMGFSALAGLAGMLLPAMPAIAAGLPAYLSTGALIALAEKSAALPGAALSIPAFPFVAVLFAYAALAAVAWSKRRSITDQFTFAKNASM